MSSERLLESILDTSCYGSNIQVSLFIVDAKRTRNVNEKREGWKQKLKK